MCHTVLNSLSPKHLRSHIITNFFSFFLLSWTPVKQLLKTPCLLLFKKKSIFFLLLNLTPSTCYISGSDNYHPWVIIIADGLITSNVHSTELTLAHSVSPTAAAPGSTVISSDSEANNLASTCTADTNLGNARSPSLLEYTHYMSRLLASEEWTPVSSPAGSSTETSPTFKGKVSLASKLRLKLQLNRIYSTCCLSHAHTVHLWACGAAEDEPHRLGQRSHWSDLLGLPAGEALVGRGVPQDSEEAEQNQSAESSSLIQTKEWVYKKNSTSP